MTSANYLIQSYQYGDKQVLAIIDTSRVLISDLGNLVIGQDAIKSSYLPGVLVTYFTNAMVPQKLSIPLGQGHIEHLVLENPPRSRFSWASNMVDINYQRGKELPDNTEIEGLEHTVRLSNLSPSDVEFLIEAIGWGLGDYKDERIIDNELFVKLI